MVEERKVKILTLFGRKQLFGDRVSRGREGAVLPVCLHLLCSISDLTALFFGYQLASGHSFGDKESMLDLFAC